MHPSSSTEKCSLAITNVLYHLWKTEKEERKEREENRLTGNANEFTKREVATCLSYIRCARLIDYYCIKGQFCALSAVIDNNLSFFIC